eukprot:contig_16901_g4105
MGNNARGWWTRRSPGAPTTPLKRVVMASTSVRRGGRWVPRARGGRQSVRWVTGTWGFWWQQLAHVRQTRHPPQRV